MEWLNTKNAIYTGLALGALYISVRSFNKLEQGAESVGSAIGETFAELQQKVNGSHDVEMTQAGFVLMEKYVGSDGSINATWKNAIVQAHPDNGLIMRRLIDTQGKLKRQYWHLIGQYVTQGELWA